MQRTRSVPPPHGCCPTTMSCATHPGSGCPWEPSAPTALGIAHPNAVGALGSHGQPEPGCVAHDIVVGQHPCGGGTDRVRCIQRVGDGVAKVTGSPLCLQELKVERLVHLVSAHISGETVLGVDPCL